MVTPSYSRSLKLQPTTYYWLLARSAVRDGRRKPLMCSDVARSVAQTVSASVHDPPSIAQGAPLVGLGPKPRGGGSSSTASGAEPPSPPPPSPPLSPPRRAARPRLSCTRAAVSCGALFLPPCACMWAVFRVFWLVRCVLGAGRTFGACPVDLSVVEGSRERPIGHLCCHRVCVPGSRFGSGCMIT